MNPASTEVSRSFAIDFRRSWVQSQVPALAVHVWVNWLREREAKMIFLSKYGPKIPRRFWKTLENFPSPTIQSVQLFLAAHMPCGRGWVFCGFPFPTSLSDWLNNPCQNSLKNQRLWYKPCYFTTTCNGLSALPNSPPFPVCCCHHLLS